MFIQKINNYLGVPVLTLIVLSLLGVPRVILHDLSIIEEGSVVNSILVFAPIIIWIAYIVLKNVNKPFLSLLLIGFFYGIFLAIVHQILWNVAMDTSIQLGGNFSNLPQAVSNIIVRTFAFFSGVTTGIVVGAITGAVGSLLNFVKKRFTPRQNKD
ncbi:hypothetical protein NP439_02110 [Oceanobacillus jeddahense]|uniref:Uncharacterized protein n=1 Tax=Oceanobacillus jeddahense TaxID=1462527 RepID=A0ABY5JT50_9BACI|nr:hypothetical protein [Oceanobacillus jeddahense]UUI03513.1 hypothetical protein NP439_02110 [Oceanobacillus jeddahense]